MPVLCSASPNNIFVVNIDKTISESIAGKAAKNDFEAELRKTKAKFVALRSGIEADSQSLSKQKGVISEENFEQKVMDLEKRKRDLNLSLEEEDQRLANLQNKELSRIFKEIEKVIEVVSKEKGDTIVLQLDGDTVLYADKNIDLTEQVLQRLNQRLN